MKGLELSENFYKAYGKPMLEEQFADILPFLAVGLAGSGSECFGFDDAVSQDHDFEPGFCIFLPGEDLVDSRKAFALERAYAKLPREFMGYRRSVLSPVGGNRHGVIRIEEFFEQKTGDKNAEIPVEGWFYIDEQFLAEATNGKLFCDPFGKMTELREKIAYLPEDVRLKKLAGYLLLMAQSGQYNYGRCVRRGESAAAQLAMGEFVNAALRVIFLLNKRYLPYYKWSFRALKELVVPETLAADLEFLISSGNTASESVRKRDTVERLCAYAAEELRRQSLSAEMSDELERHAYAVNGKIKDATVRNRHILYAVR